MAAKLQTPILLISRQNAPRDPILTMAVLYQLSYVGAGGKS
jgi:hypothetical protein